ncbi:LysR substrate-binding domain-containing protein [Curvibacter lanceolatus]|uniref:LysR substrate-binding domain-containing protein n=2 Tax=Curvibacter lanceolatus TaxID=86182 RepID=UPI00316ABEFE
MAVGACGIVAVPDTMAQARVRSGELRRVLNAWCLPPEPAWAVFLGRRLMPSKTRAFIEMLEAALKTE